MAVNSRAFPKDSFHIPTSEIQSHLASILASSAFRGSRRCQRFLTYVVGQVLNGNAASIKERTLATEVFDRSESWDSSEDTIVRVGAREVRKRLAQYYASPEGAHEKIRIELPPGSYVPEFVYAEATPASSPSVATESLTTPYPGRRSRPRTIGAAALILIVTLFAAWALESRPKSSFSSFWSPMWRSPEPVLIAIAHPLVYHPSSRATRLNNERLGPTALPIQRQLQLLPSELDGSDMIPVPDQYVGYGDTVAASNISALFAKHAHETRLQHASKLDFGDFRDMPAVLIGAFTNRWTIEFSQNLRFHFGYDPQNAPAILDAAVPSHHWSLAEKKDNGDSPEDYFLVARLVNSPSRKPLIIVAGLTQFGTEAAGRFLVDPDRVSESFQKLNAKWQPRNVEMVFHAKVIGNAPSAAQLVSTHVW